MFATLKRIKILHEIYNLVNFSKLKYQVRLYKKFGVNKRFYSSISSKDFPSDSIDNHPWLDRENSINVLPQMPQFKKLPYNTQIALLNWSKNGFAVLKEFYSSEKVELINNLFQNLIKNKRMPIKNNRKIMFTVRYSEKMKSYVNTVELTDILELLMGQPVDLFQSINFLKGSEDPAHSDFIHMSTYPYGYLIAVWIALEDINLENGPLFYYPGSHKLPYVTNSDFSHGGNGWMLGKDYRRKYADKIESIIQEQGFEKKIFTASKGDVLIWHANLLHGGSKIKNQDLTRKSMVLHYFGRDVIRYHEITERPSLLV